MSEVKYHFALFIKHKFKMFKNPFQVAVFFAFIALVIKLAIFYLGMQHGEMGSYIPFVYMLILLVAVFVGIRSNKIASETPTKFGEDFKAGARTAAFFAIIAAAITYVYYAKIDADFFAIKAQPLIDALEKNVAEKLATEPKDDVQEWAGNQIHGIRSYLSPYFQAMWTLFGLVFMGMFNSAVFAFLMKKMPGFK